MRWWMERWLLRLALWSIKACGGQHHTGTYHLCLDDARQEVCYMLNVYYGDEDAEAH